jgi:hypothetical protein
MRHTSVLLALSLLAPLTLAASASAQDQSSEVQVMDFLDGDQVTGEFQTPMVDLIGGRHLRGHRTLIRPREHFRAEMLKSVENL